MTSFFEVAFQKELDLLDRFLQSWIENYRKNVPPENKQLVEALKHALVGGKRFRPLLALLIAKAFKQDMKCVLPYACSIEFLHSYSLIHDDLPAMDNAEKRRGRLSLHKAFNEGTAILTGDALLTEAFELAVSHKSRFLQDTSSLICLLVQAVGGRGMISGQMLDLQAVDLQAVDLQAVDPQAVDPQAVDPQAVDPQVVDLQVSNNKSINLERLYDLKTGGLICASIIGAAMISGVKELDLLKLKSFAHKLGIAFQIADDLEDFNEQSDKSANVINCAHQWGVQVAKKKLYKLFSQSLEILKSIENTKGLQMLMRLHFEKQL